MLSPKNLLRHPKCKSGLWEFDDVPDDAGAWVGVGGRRGRAGKGGPGRQGGFLQRAACEWQPPAPLARAPLPPPLSPSRGLAAFLAPLLIFNPHFSSLPSTPPLCTPTRQASWACASSVSSWTTGACCPRAARPSRRWSPTTSAWSSAPARHVARPAPPSTLAPPTPSRRPPRWRLCAATPTLTAAAALLAAPRAWPPACAGLLRAARGARAAGQAGGGRHRAHRAAGALPL